MPLFRFFSGQANAAGPLGKPPRVVVRTASVELPAAPFVGAPSTVLSAEAERAVSEIYREHHAFVWRNALRLGCDDDWVDDAVHEIFVVVARRLPELEGLESERSWLFAITYRVVQRMVRDRIRHRGYLRRFAEEQPPRFAETAGAHEATEFLRHALAKQPEAQRLVLILIELEGFTAREVAATLGLPVGTVHSRLRSAKQQLARFIARERDRVERSEP